MPSSTHSPPNSRQTLTLVTDQQIDAFCDGLWSEAGLSSNSIDAYRNDVRALALWARPRQLTDLDRDQLIAWVQSGVQRGLKSCTTARRLSSVRRLYGWLVQEKYLSQDPSEKLKQPVLIRSLPTHISEKQITTLLNAPDLSTPTGVRDRAILELMYASGLRVSELVQLQWQQMDCQTGVLRVSGKGDRVRLVPIGEQALHWLNRYLQQSREQLLHRGDRSQYVFVCKRSGRLTRHSCWHAVKKYARRAGLDYNISPHDLRHAFASHLVDRGADLRTVQLLLGHRSLSTTQIYTFVAQSRQKQLHRVHHPRG